MPQASNFRLTKPLPIKLPGIYKDVDDSSWQQKALFSDIRLGGISINTFQEDSPQPSVSGLATCDSLKLFGFAWEGTVSEKGGYNIHITFPQGFVHRRVTNRAIKRILRRQIRRFVERVR